VTGVMVHPLGASVRLSDGTGGLVVAPSAPGRPWVERRYAADGARIPRERIDLRRTPTLFVTAVEPVVEARAD